MRMLRHTKPLVMASGTAVMIVCLTIWAYDAPSSVECLDTCAHGSPDANGLRLDLGEAFMFSWKSVELSTKLINPSEGNATESEEPVRIVTISVEVNWADANGLVIVDVNAPQVYETLSENGNALQYVNTKSDQTRCYRDFGWRWTREGKAYLNDGEYGRFDVKIQLSSGGHQSIPSTISILKGYIWAVYADAVVHVDVPFDPNFGTLECESFPGLTVTPDITMSPVPEPLEYICVVPSAHRGLAKFRPKRAFGLYKYDTCVEVAGEYPILALSDGIRYPGTHYQFHDYAVVRTELYDSKRNWVLVLPNQTVTNRFAGAGGVSCSGWTAQTRVPNESYDFIRHVILLRPVEVKIPFTLTSIPLTQ